VVGNTDTGPSAPVSVTVTVAAPTCALAATPAMVDLGGSSTLTASCSPAATTYAWSDAGCAAGSATCSVTPATAGIHPYTVTGSNGSGAGVPASTSVTVAVPSCTLSASPASIISGSSSTLTATCSPAATSYAWTGAACGAASPTCTVAPTANTTYTVTGSNAAGAGLPASATVTVSAPGALECRVVNVTWSAGGLDLRTIPQSTMNNGQAIAYQVTIPASFPKHFAGVFYGTVPTQLAVSPNPCEWTDAQRAAGCGTAGTGAAQIQVTGGTEAGQCQVTPGNTYYFNVKNAFTWNGADTCQPGQTCTHYLAW
jgi:hypothetical protein